MRRGEAAERFAERYLRARGLTLRERNYRSPHGEIDLIMRDGEILVFVEVRQRSNPRFGSGADTIDGRKQRRLQLTAEHYLQRQRSVPACRFDVVSLNGEGDIHWIPGAFNAE
ncbi:MAG TPA: YraN family protein [Gammaproteobacteria bacterium]|nr:YraN family protein [Gammaproteobacteria bacterium]